MTGRSRLPKGAKDRSRTRTVGVGWWTPTGRGDAAARVRGEPGEEEKKNDAGDGAVARPRDVPGGRRQAGADRHVTRYASPRFYA